MLSAEEELALLLRPAGGGLYLVSTGQEEQRATQRALYGAATDAEVEARWKAAIAALPRARGFLLAVPSDVGAGFRRGANLGPQAIRAQLLRSDPSWPARCEALGIVDIGDVFVVPQLLHDDMLSDAQKEASRRALYPGTAARLPVSPLSIAERALDLIFQLNPRAKPFVLGGDHSVAWPVASALSRVLPRGEWGIVQPDAHTDLLEERLGVKYCFATWSFHANELLGRGGRLVQVGTRASRRDRAHWESGLGVRQFWAEECRRNPDAALDALMDHVRSTRVRGVYFSNDIDGTDATYTEATGTPEPGGLAPEFVSALIKRLGREIGLIGGDVMEVAPPLGSPEGARATVELAARYFRETIDAALG